MNEKKPNELVVAVRVAPSESVIETVAFRSPRLSDVNPRPSTVTRGGSVTENITGTVWGLVATLADVIVMLPAYWPAAKPVGLAVTTRFDGAEPQ